jgi:hypothetical protein
VSKGHWSAEQQAQFAAGDVGESREVRQDLKVEELRVEGDRLVNVIDHVPDAYHVIAVSHVLSLSSCHIARRYPSYA